MKYFWLSVSYLLFQLNSNRLFFDLFLFLTQDIFSEYIFSLVKMPLSNLEHLFKIKCECFARAIIGFTFFLCTLC